MLVVAPFFTSFLLRTLAWKQILADDGLGGRHPARSSHILGAGRTASRHRVAVVFGMTYNFLPFMMLPLYASLERLDPRLMEAAGDLYANAFTTLRKVTFPLSLPGVVAGTLLTFIPAAGDYVNAALLGNPATPDDRQRHRQPVPAGRRLPDRRGAVVDPDGRRSWSWSWSTSAAPAPRSCV